MRLRENILNSDSVNYSFGNEFLGLRNGSMIVSRMQDHTVETSDGALHMVVNLGLGKGLTLLSSLDNGESWVETVSIPESGPFTSSDIQLSPDGSTLMLTYLGAHNVVTFASYSYDESSNGWVEVANTELSTEGHNPFSVLPTIDIGPTGRIWSSFASPDENGLKLTVQYSDDDGTTWSVLETVVSTGTSGVAKVIATGSGVGIVVATENSLSWITYENGNWVTEVISSDGTAGAFSSHFSTVVVGNDIYLCNITPDGEAQLFKFNSADGEWTSVQVPELENLETTTVQTSFSDEGVLYVIVDDPENSSLKILASSDGGESWTSESVFYPANLAGYPLRFDTPEYFSGDLVITVQVDIGSNVGGVIEIRIDLDSLFGIALQQSEPVPIELAVNDLFDFETAPSSIETSDEPLLGELVDAVSGVSEPVSISLDLHIFQDEDGFQDTMSDSIFDIG
jgi:hypothetical protein